MPISRRATLATLRRTALAACLAAALMADAAPDSAPSKPAEPASVRIVGNCLDDGSYASLRSVVARANAGDTIDMTALQCSTITLASGEIQATVPGLKFKGPGADALTIDAEGASQVLVAKYDVAIEGLTLANGYASDAGGGCVYVDGDLTLVDSVVTTCGAIAPMVHAAYGGALFVTDDVEITSSQVTYSYASAASAYGGGVYAGGNALIQSSLIAGNAADATTQSAYGGGIFARGVVTVSASEIGDNEANTQSSTSYGAFGGGIYAKGASPLFIVDGSELHDNTAYSASGNALGGGAHAGNGTIVVRHSSVSGNLAEGDLSVYGGGICTFAGVSARYSAFFGNDAIAHAGNGKALGGGIATQALHGSGTITLRDSTVAYNSAVGGAMTGTGGGGGIAAIYLSPFVLTNSTIAYNSASHFGGGIVGSADGGANLLSLRSSIVANNEANGGESDIARKPGDSTPLVIDDDHGDHNLVMAVEAGVTLPADTISDAPGPLVLEDNGGPTPTMALAPDSPALDAGSNAGVLGCDQRGAPFVREAGPPDIGAYELQPHPEYLFSSDFELFTPCE